MTFSVAVVLCWLALIVRALFNSHAGLITLEHFDPVLPSDLILIRVVSTPDYYSKFVCVALFSGFCTLVFSFNFS